MYNPGINHTVWKADHPSTFWPDHPDVFTKHNNRLLETLTPEQKEARRQQLLDLIKKRLESDRAHLQKKQQDTSHNLKRLRETRDRKK